MVGVSLSAIAVLDAFKNTIDAGDKMEKMAQKTGIAVEALSKYRYVASLADTDLDSLGSALAKLAKNMQDASANPSTSLANTFKQMGISAQELKSGDVQGVFEKIADQLAAAADGGRKTAIEMQLLGKSGNELTPFINSLREGKAEADALGINVSTKFAKDSAQFNDNISKSVAILDQFRIKILSGVLPALNELLERMNGAESSDTLSNMRRRTIERLSELDDRAKKLGGVEQYAIEERQRLEKTLGELDAKLLAKNDAFIKKFTAEDVAKKSKGGGLPDIVDEGRLKEITNFLQGIKKQAAEAQADISDDERAKALDRVQISKDEWIQKAAVLHLGIEDQKKFIAEFNNWVEKTTALALKKTESPIEQLTRKWANSTLALKEASASWLDDMSSKLTEFVMTGKLNFKDFARSVIADIIKIKIQKQLAGIFGGSTGTGLVGSLGTLLGFADGGNPPIGRASLVGENGPELIIPRAAMTVVPNGVGGGIVINQTFQISTGVQQTVRAEIMQMMPQIKDQTTRAVAEERRRGGSFATAFG